MKKLIILAFAAIAAFASEIAVGQQFLETSFVNQHEKNLEITNDTKKVIIAFTKKSGSVVNDFLNENKGYLKDTQSVYLTDVSQVPSFVMSFFMLPKFREYYYEIGLVEDESISKLLPKKDEMLTIIELDNRKITSISFSKNLL